MNEDLYGLQASGIDPEIAAKLIPLQRQRAIADALLKQSMDPLTAGPTPQGGFTPRVHPLQGIAKIVQAYMARKGLEEADLQRQELAGENQRLGESQMGTYENMRKGTPEIANIPDAGPGDAVDTTSTIPAKQGDSRAAIAYAAMKPMLMKNPLIGADLAAMRMEDKPFVLGRSLVDKSGKTLATDTTWAQEREAERLARQDQAKAQAEERAARDKAATESKKELITLAASLRGPQAPTMSEVIDPKDPSRMLRVDAKAYKGGSLGDVGVLGISGKEPTAAKREEQVGQGRETVSTLISGLRDRYKALQEGGGIVDPDNGLLPNLAAGIGSSDVGQFVGGKVGTQNQSERNTIAQSRPLLLNAIKQATGMSAKQMDSNAELKMYLAAATDPKLDIKANLAALDNLDKLYGLGLGAQSSNVSTGKVRTATTPANKLSPQEQKELEELRARFKK